MAREGYTSLRVLAAVADDLRRLTRRVSAAADRDVSQSEVLGELLARGLEKPDELAARLAREGEGTHESH